MSDKLPPKTPSQPYWFKMAFWAAWEGRVRFNEVVGHCRKKRASRARWRAWRAILDTGHYSVLGVARTTGFDHTSILYAMKRLNGAGPRDVHKYKGEYIRGRHSEPKQPYI